jgi:hypothetical protein
MLALSSSARVSLSSVCRRASERQSPHVLLYWTSSHVHEWRLASVSGTAPVTSRVMLTRRSLDKLRNISCRDGVVSTGLDFLVGNHQSRSIRVEVKLNSPDTLLVLATRDAPTLVSLLTSADGRRRRQ